MPALYQPPAYQASDLGQAFQKYEVMYWLFAIENIVHIYLLNSLKRITTVLISFIFFLWRTS